MTAIPLGLSSYKRIQGRLPESLLRNMYVEPAPNEAGKIALLSFPGLVREVDELDGAFRGLFQQPGTFSGDLLAVAGQKAYRIVGAIETELGAIPGTERVWMAANATTAYITTGPAAYSTNGATVSTLATPSSLGFSSVGTINQYFLFSQTGTSRFYWLEPGETVIDPLNFANAESGPDAIIAVVVLGDEIWLFGEATTEVWIPTGNPAAPFQRVGGRGWARGCRDRDSIAKMDNSIYWVGNDGIVYRADAQPVRVSDHTIEERIALSTSVGAWSFALDGHTFYVLTLVGGASPGTFCYDVSTKTWPERKSYGFDYWRARVGLNIGSEVYAGDILEGALWSFDREAFADDDGPMIRVCTGIMNVIGQQVPCDSFSADCSLATTVDPYDNPVATLRVSDDGGNEWKDFGHARVGKVGAYATRLRWGRLGRVQPPGRLFQLIMSDRIGWRVSQASVNEVF